MEKEIASWLGRIMKEVSIPTVARDLQEAESDEWIVTRFAEDKLGLEGLSVVREKIHHAPWQALEDKLKDMSGGVLKHLWVFPSGSRTEPPSTKANWDKWLKRFANNASWFTNEQLSRSQECVAVSWGKTVASMIDGLFSRWGRLERASQSARKAIKVIPTAGDPLGDKDVDLNNASTHLAVKLNEYLNGPGKQQVPSLEGIPSVIPERFKSADKLIVIREYIRTMRSYKDIFGDPNDVGKSPPWIKRVDTVLTSAGSFHSWVVFKSQLTNVGGVSKDELDKLASGDIGGVLIPRAEVENNPRDMAKFEQISSLWTGVELGDYQRIAQKAANISSPNGPSGVILCVIGQNKVDIVFDLITRVKVVNTLVCDEAIALALSNRQRR
jgi:hypothetical protein